MSSISDIVGFWSTFSFWVKTTQDITSSMQIYNGKNLLKISKNSRNAYIDRQTIRDRREPSTAKFQLKLYILMDKDRHFFLNVDVAY